jgi:hypothetical protein
MSKDASTNAIREEELKERIKNMPDNGTYTFFTSLNLKH